MDSLEGTRRLLDQYPDSKIGFVVYRATYKDDAEWKRFMEHLTNRTRLNLESEGAGDLFERLDWSVQEDPALEGALTEEIRE